MQIELKIKPLSINCAFQGRRFKTPAYKKFERDLMFLIPVPKKPIPEMLRIEYFFGFSSPLADLDNPVKMVTDCLQTKLGFNDRNVWELNVRKCIVPKGQEFISIGIYPYLPL